ncbi:MAG: ABC transporter ATP-binding protein [Theionarchaea archaeon]|nr:ABC transporter ATP-binding protein [Theionarchaea archaeon]MBU7000255.1 ABC transporter ATP-binding protein [Theionarchaea archaeon]MBU7022056.1 ABC transporter ATP-binding protein [Theionarchaea archaeon]MBU7034738.1 ABC transporter ATP-binding protein [Theionarchaea archaeon]MBU7040475.1 ABC transporter ATP-binding protein [Theionarchaea archaeon]
MSVEISGLWYSYPDGTPALKNINLKIGPGERVALMGANGSGKTTLLLVLAGIFRGKGAVAVLGEHNLERNRGRIGLVFQNPDDQLFMPSVFDDVAFGPINLRLDHVDQRVAQALERVGLPGYERRCPHHLSFGEKKRVSIATVLSMEPELLLLDEPTATLDPRGKWQLLQILDQLPQTMVVATHDSGVASRVCPRTVLLNGGSIAADGSTDRLLSDEPLLEESGLKV